MTNKSERFDIYNVIRPRTIAIGGGMGVMAELSHPWPIATWRNQEFQKAVVAKLQENDTDISKLSPEDKSLLLSGCQEAGFRSNSMYGYRDNDLGDLDEGVRTFSPGMEKVANLLGPQFNEIYDSTPPTELIDYILSDDYKIVFGLLVKPNPAAITVEVLRGRLEWRDRYSEAGAPTPQAYIGKVAAQLAQ